MAQYAGRAVGWDGVPSSCEQAAGLGMTMTAPGTLNTGHWPLMDTDHRRRATLSPTCRSSRDN